MGATRADPTAHRSGAAEAGWRPQAALRRAGVVVLGLLASAIALFLFTGHRGGDVADLARGDCLKSALIADGSGDVTNLEVVACQQAHDAEVVASAIVDDSEGPTDACLQAITDEGTSVAARSIDGREVKPLSTYHKVACLVFGEGLERSIPE